MKTRAYILVSGRVQGVFFRSSAAAKAKELGITGWVRNLEDGRVEALFEGDYEKIEKMLQWCKKGPEYARVDDVEAVFEDYKGEFSGFTIKRDRFNSCW